MELLRANDLAESVTPLPLTPTAGAEALLKGEVDCACVLTSWDAPIVRKLLGDERVSLMSMPRADAYVALYPHVLKLVVPRGVGSLAKDLPRQDATVIAVMSSLLVREDLHPAIQFLLLEAASEIHSGPGMFRRPGQFPAPEPVDFPLAPEARTYYKSGGTFFQRHLPFWLGVLAQRILLVLIPLAGVLYPLARLLPALVLFVFELRLRSVYKELRRIESRLAAGDPGAPSELSALEEKVSAIRVPAWGARSFYILKQHLALVRARFASPPEDPAEKA